MVAGQLKILIWKTPFTLPDVIKISDVPGPAPAPLRKYGGTALHLARWGPGANVLIYYSLKYNRICHPGGRTYY